MSIAYQLDQGVATITIDRPEKKNAITGDMYDAARRQPETGRRRKSPFAPC